jgi:hypothetical protein
MGGLERILGPTVVISTMTSGPAQKAKSCQLKLRAARSCTAPSGQAVWHTHCSFHKTMPSAPSFSWARLRSGLVPLALGFSLTLGFVNHRLTSIWIFLLPGSRILVGPSSLRVLSDPWFCESQTYRYLGFPSSGSTFYTIFRTVHGFSPHNFPYKGVHLGRLRTQSPVQYHHEGRRRYYSIYVRKVYTV